MFGVGPYAVPKTWPAASEQLSQNNESPRGLIEEMCASANACQLRSATRQ